MIRGAYFYVHEKRTKDANKAPIPEDQQKYEFVGLIPKLNADPAQCPNYRLFSDLAMTAVQGQEEWRGNWPAGGNWPIKDGDDPVKSAKYPWQKGCWVINFSGNFPPKVAILQNGAPTEIPARRIGTQDLYKSGDYCVVSTYAFTYDNKTRGVKFDMEGVLFMAPGEVIGTASRSVNDMFGTAAPGAAPGPAPAMAPPTIAPPPVAPVAPSPAPQYAAAPPVAPVAAAPVGYAQPPMPPAMAPVGGPPMPPVAAPSVGLPPFPGR
ncbi:ssDNA-binding protein [Nitrobacteraceae bacterium UC4446_H13]